MVTMGFNSSDEEINHTIASSHQHVPMHLHTLISTNARSREESHRKVIRPAR